MKGDPGQSSGVRPTVGKKAPRKSRDPDYVCIKANKDMLERLRAWKPKTKT